MPGTTKGFSGQYIDLVWSVDRTASLTAAGYGLGRWLGSYEIEAKLGP